MVPGDRPFELPASYRIEGSCQRRVAVRGSGRERGPTRPSGGPSGARPRPIGDRTSAADERTRCIRRLGRPDIPRHGPGDRRTQGTFGLWESTRGSWHRLQQHRRSTFAPMVLERLFAVKGLRQGSLRTSSASRHRSRQGAATQRRRTPVAGPGERSSHPGPFRPQTSGAPSPSASAVRYVHVPATTARVTRVMKPKSSVSAVSPGW